jgi:hypothetical protein
MLYGCGATGRVRALQDKKGERVGIDPVAIRAEPPGPTVDRRQRACSLEIKLVVRLVGVVVREERGAPAAGAAILRRIQWMRNQ